MVVIFSVERIHSRQSRVVAIVLVAAVLAFAVQSALEAIHPIEEDVAVSVGHTHGNTWGPAIQDPGQGDLGAHDHHFCAHSNAMAFVATPHPSFQHMQSVAPVVSGEGAPRVRSLFAVLDRGPPLL